jgi:heparanase
VPGGVAMLVLNNSQEDETTLNMTVPADRYTLTARELTAGSVMLNGRPIALAESDELPTMAGQSTASGPLTFAPASITFLALPSAKNSACQ